VTANLNSQIPNSQFQERDVGEYCRQVEQHLCRRNEGHLIRLAGPRFDLVQDWFNRGIPLKLAMQGIDRGVERRRLKDARPRPVPIEFCEGDVLDVFEEWRRSVGVSASDTSTGELAAPTSSLPAHLERVIARLTALRGGADRSLDATLDTIVRELDAVRVKAKTIRGDARDALIERLRQLDIAVVDALRERADETMRRQMAAEADEELRPFRARMPAEEYARSHRACIDRLLRERAGVPAIAYE